MLREVNDVVTGGLEQRQMADDAHSSIRKVLKRSACAE